MSTTLTRFFSQLATRATRENEVSDVLYAALSSAPELYAIFAHHLGLPSTPPAEIVREYVTGGVRPDFLFTSDAGTSVLLEVKLFDRNYHYDEYSRLQIAAPLDRIEPLPVAGLPQARRSRRRLRR